MNRSDLKEYLRNKLALQSLDIHTDCAYDTYKSPSFEAKNTNKSDPQDPTMRALRRIEKLVEDRAEIQSKIEAVEDFVSKIDDGYEQAICRLHYLTGYSWEATCLYMRGHKSSAVIQEYDRRFWERLEKEEND